MDNELKKFRNDQYRNHYLKSQGRRVSKIEKPIQPELKMLRERLVKLEHLNKRSKDGFFVPVTRNNWWLFLIMVIILLIVLLSSGEPTPDFIWPNH